MKTPVVILLITLILLQTFSKGLIILDYTLNKEFIAKVLCINRDKPLLQCKGKCQLNKKLKQAEETEKKTNPSSANTVEIIWFYQAATSVNPVLYSSIQKVSSFYQSTYQFSFLSATFHPPQFTL